MKWNLGRALFAAALVVLGAGCGGDSDPPSGAEPGVFGFEPGELVTDFRFEDVGGAAGSLAGLLEGKRALVLFLRTVECPVSQRYGHRLAELEREYGAKGVAFAYLNVSFQDTAEDIRKDIETFGFAGPYISDREGRIGRHLQAKVSSEVYVIDAARTLRYRGAVDDQFGITFSKPVVRKPYVRDALDALLAGEAVEHPRTEASGCYLERKSQAAPAREITYHSRVSRILQKNCVSCHHEGSVAPFALDNYANAFGFRHMIQHVVEQRIMPPWYANPDYGTWKNEMVLSEREKRDLYAWVAAGGPEGDPALAPQPVEIARGWLLGEEPDAVIELDEPQQIPERGVLDYRYVYLKTSFPEDKWVRAAQLMPTAHKATHHVIAYLEEPEDEIRGPYFIGWSPGMPPSRWPDGSAKRLPAGATLLLEIHYIPNGTAQEDRTRIGLLFADAPTELEVETGTVGTGTFAIPPHAPNHEVVANRRLFRDGTLLSLLPHMHLRGKAFRYELIRRDGVRTVLLDVPRYDFNWQLWYEFREPVRLRAGDVIRAQAWYDNSESNPANPDPTVWVRYGRQTTDEMMFGYFEWIPKPGKEASGAGRGSEG